MKFEKIKGVLGSIKLLGWFKLLDLKYNHS